MAYIWYILQFNPSSIFFQDSKNLSVHIICWLLLATFYQVCYAEEHILFDSQKSPELLVISGKWKNNARTNTFGIVSCTTTDIIATRRKVEYPKYGFKSVYVNFTYAQDSSAGNLVLTLQGYVREIGTTDYIVLSRSKNYTFQNEHPPLFIPDARAGFEFTLRCSNFTGSITKIVIFTYYCPSTVIGGAYFPRIETLANSAIKKQSTSCINGSTSIVSKLPSLLCSSRGEYLSVPSYNACLCSEGFGYANGTCQGNRLN